MVWGRDLFHSLSWGWTVLPVAFVKPMSLSLHPSPCGLHPKSMEVERKGPFLDSVHPRDLSPSLCWHRLNSSTPLSPTVDWWALWLLIGFDTHYSVSRQQCKSYTHVDVSFPSPLRAWEKTESLIHFGHPPVHGPHPFSRHKPLVILKKQCVQSRHLKSVPLTSTSKM